MNPYERNTAYIKTLYRIVDLQCTRNASMESAISVGEEMKQTLKELEDLIKKEKEMETKDLRNPVRGKVLSFKNSVATIECEIPSFEEGDELALVENKKITPLGHVLDCESGIVTIQTLDWVVLSEGQEVKLCKAPNLLAYELQLQLIDELKRSESQGAEIDPKTLMLLDIFFGKKEFGNLNFVKEDSLCLEKVKLDESQQRIVEAALGLGEGELLLIVGPPGTGKTTVIAEVAHRFANKGCKVLISSHTNRAVDNAVEKLPLEITLRVGRPEKIHREVRKYCLMEKARSELGKELEEIEREISYLKGELRRLRDVERRRKEEIKKCIKWEEKKILILRMQKNEIASVENRLRELIERRNELLINTFKSLVDRAKIIGSTLIKSNLRPLDTVDFDVAIIDESSQASITLAMLGMRKAKRWILIGDHRQLLPIFKTVDPTDIKKLERLSSFVLLKKKYEERTLWLKRHYRCNPKIIGFSIKNVYEKLDGVSIQIDEVCKQQRLPAHRDPILDGEKPVVFVDVEGEEYSERENDSKLNVEEAKVVARIVRKFLEAKIRPDEIGVITPYKLQKNEISSELNKIGSEKVEEIEVSTVDAFQGREKDVIIFSVTATKNFKFVEVLNRLNVAFTRAKKKLVVVGNAERIVQYGNYLRYFLNYAEKYGVVLNSADLRI